MSQEISNQKDTHLNEMLEIKNYAEFKHKVLSNIPNLKLIAKIFMKEHIKKLTGQDIDPDHVRIYSDFESKSPLATSYSGWQYYGPKKSLTLTDLAFKNFSAHDQDQTPDDLKLIYGIYKDGPKEKTMMQNRWGARHLADHFTAKDQVKILPSDLRKILNENDFYSLVKNNLNTFWEKHEADMLTLAKATFVSEARRARLEGVLSEDDYKLVMQTVVPHLPLEGPVTINQLASKTYSQGCVYSLDINGYSSNDILRFVKSDGHEILYIPGEKRPFEVFENDTAMRHWIVEQAKNSEKLSRLESHFSLYNRQDGYFHKGVDNGLLNLISGSWDISGSGIDKNGNVFFASDVLSTVIKKTKERSFSDADIVIKSNAEITWEQWLGYTKIANQMFGPIVGLCGTFWAILATGTFVAQIGMEIHQAVTGDTEEERKEGFWAASIDIGTTLLFAGFAKFVEVKNELSELSELADPYTEVHINNAAEKQVRGFIEGINKSISVVKVAEDKNGKDIWMRYDPITEKVFGRRYYRSEDYSDILEPIPLPMSERLNKIRTEGLSGKGSKEADRNMAAESSTSRKLLASVDEMTHSKPTEKLKLDKQKRSLNLNLSSSSSSVTTTDIQSLLKKSKINWLQNNQYLSVFGSDNNIYQRFEVALNKIESTDTGSTLLKSIDEILRDKSMKLAIYLDSEDLGVVPHSYADAHNSHGTGSDFYCNLNKIQHTSEQAISQENFDACKIFHELIHVLNNLKGERLVNNLNGERIDIEPLSSETETYISYPPLLEEAKTVGLGDYSEEALSENKFRKEIGVPRRTSYPHDSYIIHDNNTVTKGFEQKKLYPRL